MRRDNIAIAEKINAVIATVREPACRERVISVPSGDGEYFEQQGTHSWAALAFSRSGQDAGKAGGVDGAARICSAFALVLKGALYDP